MFHFSQTTRSIRFVCRPEDYGVIAPPVAAKTVLPDWFRKLPAVDSQQASATNNGLTVQALHAVSRCDDNRLDPGARGDRPP